MLKASDMFNSLSPEELKRIQEEIKLSVRNLLTILNEEYEMPDLLTGPDANLGLKGLEKIISEVSKQIKDIRKEMLIDKNRNLIQKMVAMVSKDSKNIDELKIELQELKDLEYELNLILATESRKQEKLEAAACKSCKSFK